MTSTSTSPAPDHQPRLDHVAVASRRAWPLVTRYGHQLGGRWLGGPVVDDDGFYFCQIEFAGGTKIELLEPLPGPGSDFLRRFLQRNGPGPHHLTFKVGDFDRAVAAVEADGYDVIAIDRSDPDWHEGFLHPKQSHGIVIQLAWQSPDGDSWDEPTELPPSLRAVPQLDTVEHLVADLDAARALFAGPLGMIEKERSTADDGERSIMVSGPWQLLLIEPRRPDWRDWLGSRPGRLLQLSFTVDDPSEVPDAERTPAGDYEIGPEHNLGTRIRLRPGPGGP